MLQKWDSTSNGWILLIYVWFWVDLLFIMHSCWNCVSPPKARWQKYVNGFISVHVTQNILTVESLERVYIVDSFQSLHGIQGFQRIIPSSSSKQCIFCAVWWTFEVIASKVDMQGSRAFSWYFVVWMCLTSGAPDFLSCDLSYLGHLKHAFKVQLKLCNIPQQQSVLLQWGDLWDWGIPMWDAFPICLGYSSMSRWNLQRKRTYHMGWIMLCSSSLKGQWSLI